MSWFGDVTHSASSTASSASSTVTSTVTSTTTSAGNSFTRGVKSAWSATSVEATAVGQGIESSGMVIGQGFVDGTQFAAGIAKEGLEVAEKSAVGAGEYVSAHACDIALGSALGAVFAALASDGEEEVTMSSFVAAAAVGTFDRVLVTSAADAVAAALVTPIWTIPQVSSTVGHKDLVIALLSWVLVKLVSEKPELVVGTGGQVVAGIVISVVTSLVCEGTLPGGFVRVWKGAQS